MYIVNFILWTSIYISSYGLLWTCMYISSFGIASTLHPLDLHVHFNSFILWTCMYISSLLSFGLACTFHLFYPLDLHVHIDLQTQMYIVQMYIVQMYRTRFHKSLSGSKLLNFSSRLFSIFISEIYKLVKLFIVRDKLSNFYIALQNDN